MSVDQAIAPKIACYKVTSAGRSARSFLNQATGWQDRYSSVVIMAPPLPQSASPSLPVMAVFGSVFSPNEAQVSDTVAKHLVSRVKASAAMSMGLLAAGIRMLDLVPGLRGSVESFNHVGKLSSSATQPVAASSQLRPQDSLLGIPVVYVIQDISGQAGTLRVNASVWDFDLPVSPGDVVICFGNQALGLQGQYTMLQLYQDDNWLPFILPPNLANSRFHNDPLFLTRALHGSHHGKDAHEPDVTRTKSKDSQAKQQAELGETRGGPEEEQEVEQQPGRGDKEEGEEQEKGDGVAERRACDEGEERGVEKQGIENVGEQGSKASVSDQQTGVDGTQSTGGTKDSSNTAASDPPTATAIAQIRSVGPTSTASHELQLSLDEHTSTGAPKSQGEDVDMANKEAGAPEVPSTARLDSVTLTISGQNGQQSGMDGEPTMSGAKGKDEDEDMEAGKAGPLTLSAVIESRTTEPDPIRQTELLQDASQAGTGAKEVTDEPHNSGEDVDMEGGAHGELKHTAIVETASVDATTTQDQTSTAPRTVAVAQTVSIPQTVTVPRPVSVPHNVAVPQTVPVPQADSAVQTGSVHDEVEKTSGMQDLGEDADMSAADASRNTPATQAGSAQELVEETREPQEPELDTDIERTAVPQIAAVAQTASVTQTGPVPQTGSVQDQVEETSELQELEEKTGMDVETEVEKEAADPAIDSSTATQQPMLDNGLGAGSAPAGEGQQTGEGEQGETGGLEDKGDHEMDVDEGTAQLPTDEIAARKEDDALTDTATLTSSIPPKSSAVTATPPNAVSLPPSRNLRGTPSWKDDDDELRTDAKRSATVAAKRARDLAKSFANVGASRQLARNLSALSGTSAIDQLRKRPRQTEAEQGSDGRDQPGDDDDAGGADDIEAGDDAEDVHGRNDCDSQQTEGDQPTDGDDSDFRVNPEAASSTDSKQPSDAGADESDEYQPIHMQAVPPGPSARSNNRSTRLATKEKQEKAALLAQQRRKAQEAAFYPKPNTLAALEQEESRIQKFLDGAGRLDYLGRSDLHKRMANMYV